MSKIDIILRDPYPNEIMNMFGPFEISLLLLMHLHLTILFSKRANRKLFLFPFWEQSYLKFKSVYPPNTLPFVAFTIVTVLFL